MRRKKYLNSPTPLSSPVAYTIWNRIKPVVQNEIFLVATILILSVGTHFYRFDHPNEIVFDELHFANFITNHLAHKYYFDIHPPLAKIILAETAQLFGHNPDFSFTYEKIGKEYSHADFYRFVRLIVTLFGALLPLCIFFLARELFHNKWPAFIAAFLVIFDNALLVHSRYILTDIFLLDFGILGLAFLAMHLRLTKEKKQFKLAPVLLAGLFLGASLAVKWTGLVFTGVAGFMLIFELIRVQKFKYFALQCGLLALMVTSIYTASFAWHLHTLTKSGPGDDFMSQEFQATLEGNQNANDQNLTRPAFLAQFIELNTVMYRANKGITAEHSYGSRWYSWPVMHRTIYYWNQEAREGKEEKIYLLGNPAIWWVGFAVMLIITFHTLAYLYVGKRDGFLTPLALIIIGYWANLLPYAAISRVSFLYHYFPSFLFMVIGLGYYLWYVFGSGKKLLVIVGYLAIVVIMYLYFSPLTYGVALTPAQFDARMWFETWK